MIRFCQLNNTFLLQLPDALFVITDLRQDLAAVLAMALASR